ncbi:hypothetical protein SDC9_94675 [bioreactor metagenome]|uniref:Uncharacterized protein n=1 Tax=bioreactor metagenome TaxID=1076179 RepID=A0A645AE58_9ZZZZ
MIIILVQFKKYLINYTSKEISIKELMRAGTVLLVKLSGQKLSLKMESAQIAADQ